jgi:hypothetical protein
MNSHSLLRRLAILAAAALLGGQALACGFTWEYTLQDALTSAALWNRPVVLVFTGSDWSPRSIKLDQEIFSNTQFANWFGDSFSPCNADFPQRRPLPDATLAENTSLAMKFNVKHFPTLIALRPDGTEFARLEYNGESLAQMTAIVKSWHAHFEDPPVPGSPSPNADRETVAR